MKPLTTIRHADSFYNIGGQLLSHQSNAVYFFAYDFALCIFCLAQACEFYLKLLCRMSGRNTKIPKTHELSDLVVLLDEKTLAFIRLKYESLNPMLSYWDCIHLHSNANPTFRYFYEQSHASAEPRSLFCLATALRDTAIDASNNIEYSVDI